MNKSKEYIKRYGKRYCYEWYARTMIDRLSNNILLVNRKLEKLKKRMVVLEGTRTTIQIVAMIIALRKLYKYRQLRLRTDQQH